MSIEKISRVGYGFLFEPLNKDDGALEAFEALEADGMDKVKHLTIDIGGNMISGENIQIVAFLKDPEPAYMSNYEYETGVFGFDGDDAPELTDEIIYDLEIVRKHFRLINRLPIPVALFSVS